MENTLENKAKFFAQYWGQKVLSDLTNSGDRILYPVEASNMYRIQESYLELKPLSSITDEDAKEIAIQNRFTHGENEQAFVTVGKDILDRVFNGEKYEITMPICLPYESADFLRSKGYAVPWMGLSVEELESFRWIKLIEDGK